ncbi:MAG: hypothetical protein OER95_13190 [Acidimicrobiia bacterium]|nr:hypothetical protein [Acidimicrobiia bacterium]
MVGWAAIVVVGLLATPSTSYVVGKWAVDEITELVDRDSVAVTLSAGFDPSIVEVSTTAAEAEVVVVVAGLDVGCSAGSDFPLPPNTPTVAAVSAWPAANSG